MIDIDPNILEAARQGNATAQQILAQKHHLKVYTEEDMEGVKMLQEISQVPLIDLSDQEVYIGLPDLRGQKWEARINWLRDHGSGFFEAGCTYTEGEGMGFHTVWMLRKDPEVGFRPLFNALGWKKDE